MLHEILGNPVAADLHPEVYLDTSHPIQVYVCECVFVQVCVSVCDLCRVLGTSGSCAKQINCEIWTFFPPRRMLCYFNNLTEVPQKRSNVEDNLAQHEDFGI